MLRSRSGAPCCSAGTARTSRTSRTPTTTSPTAASAATATTALRGGRGSRIAGGRRRTAAAARARRPSPTRLAASPPETSGSPNDPTRATTSARRTGSRRARSGRRPSTARSRAGRRARASPRRAIRARARGRAPAVAGTASAGAERRAPAGLRAATPRPRRIVVVARIPVAFAYPTGARAVDRHARRDDVLEQAAHRRDSRASEHAEQEIARAAPRHREERRRGRACVDERPLGLERGGIGRDRPRARDRLPGRQPDAGSRPARARGGRARPDRRGALPP